jgi:hypothetical protein
MKIGDILFYTFSILLVLSALMVVLCHILYMLDWAKPKEFRPKKKPQLPKHAFEDPGVLKYLILVITDLILGLALRWIKSPIHCKERYLLIALAMCPYLLSSLVGISYEIFMSVDDMYIMAFIFCLYVISVLMVVFYQHLLFSFLYLGCFLLLGTFWVIEFNWGYLDFLTLMIIIGWLSEQFLRKAMGEISYMEFRAYYFFLWACSACLLPYACYGYPYP